MSARRADDLCRRADSRGRTPGTDGIVVEHGDQLPALDVGTGRLLPPRGERDAFARQPEQEPVVVGEEPVLDRDVEILPLFGEHPGDGRDAGPAR